MMYGLSGCAWSGGCARELAKHSADREQADRAQEGLGVRGGDWRKCGWLVLELRRSRRALDSPSDIFQLVIDNPVNIPLGRDLQFSSANNLIFLLQRDFLKAGSGGVLRVGGGRAVENVKRNRQ